MQCCDLFLEGGGGVGFQDIFPGGKWCAIKAAFRIVFVKLGSIQGTKIKALSRETPWVG